MLDLLLFQHLIALAERIPDGAVEVAEVDRLGEVVERPRCRQSEAVAASFTAVSITIARS